MVMNKRSIKRLDFSKIRRNKLKVTFKYVKGKGLIILVKDPVHPGKPATQKLIKYERES